MVADPFASDQEIDSEDDETLSKLDSEIMYRIVDNVLEGFNDDTPKATETIKLDDSDGSVTCKSKKRKRNGKYGMFDSEESESVKEEVETKKLTELSIKEEEEAPVTIVTPSDLKNESMKKQ
eukprot:CAMPEP_0176347814 /NCGR_PEP_ID=MMETSP0126-20121128/7371_1 /TAXON_ID=141414 ORGANISM="Strombidinopsis acuminatum, Strain SPMC142" /NCGR_SAMPLE_ID=MMETSP0126 /ASSEMBLY_ACC=CAM_ASM_000229 /LENGTH=121 /DNA_ID=CAMNT_0017696241 /DNA_START=646 /DNA_END=1011 /DNA_ORIENTATION=-